MQVSSKLDTACDSLYERIRSNSMKLIGTVVEAGLEAILQQHFEGRLYLL
ncbi:MAG: hypothetical protein ACTS77_02020 [Arsenophonus sp. NC-TX2-MAG3]